VEDKLRHQQARQRFIIAEIHYNTLQYITIPYNTDRHGSDNTIARLPVATKKYFFGWLFLAQLYLHFSIFVLSKQVQV
jgi:hypothetical protein